MNFITITGRLVKEPEKKTTSTGSTLASFYVADERPGKNGEKKTVYHSCTAWGKKGDFVLQYFHKGKPIGINGSIQMDSYEKDGEKVQFYKVVADEIFFLPGESAQKPAQQNGGFDPNDTVDLDF